MTGARLGRFLVFTCLGLLAPTAHAATTEAYFVVTKTFSNASPLPVEVSLECNGGLPLQQSNTLSHGQSVEFLVTHFTDGLMNCTVSEVVPAGYDASYNDGSISTNNCSYSAVTDQAQVNCDITNTPNRATFTVSKTFTDNNPGSVQVNLSCNSGFPLEQNISLSNGESVDFVVTSFQDGSTDCTVSENVPSGYDASYDDGSVSSTNCTYNDLALGAAVNCDITNTPNRATFTVSKTFTDANPGSVQVNLSCNSGFPLEQNISLSNGESVDFVVASFQDGSTDCTVSENVPSGYDASYDDGSVSSANCTYNDLALGAAVNCNITNTPNPDALSDFQACNAPQNCAIAITGWIPPTTLAPIAEQHCNVATQLQSGNYLEAAAQAIKLHSDINLISSLPIDPTTVEACTGTVVNEYYDYVINNGMEWSVEKNKLLEHIYAYNPDLDGLSFLWQLWVGSPVSVTVSDGVGGEISISADGQAVSVDESFKAIAIPFGDQKKLMIFVDQGGRDYDIKIEGENTAPDAEFVLDLMKFGETEKHLVPFAPTTTSDGALATVNLSVAEETLEIEIDADGDGTPEETQQPDEVVTEPASFLYADSFEN